MALNSLASRKATQIGQLPATQKARLKTLNDRMHEKQDVQRQYEAEFRRAKQDQLFTKQSQLPHSDDKRAELIRQTDQYVEQCTRDVEEARAAVAEINEQMKVEMVRLRKLEATAKAVLAALEPEDQYLIHRVNQFTANWQPNIRGA